MLEVRWKIGEKPRGRWRTPFQFTLEVKNTKEIFNLRPRFIFQKEYELPTKIYAGTAALKEGCNTCKERKKINISISRYIEEPVIFSVQMIFFECYRVCDDCKASLPWRPGRPDYTDFEEFFQQIANDLLEAWNKAVEEAASSEEYEGEEVIITSDLLIKRKEEEKLAEKPSRKIRIA